MEEREETLRRKRRELFTDFIINTFFAQQIQKYNTINNMVTWFD